MKKTLFVVLALTSFATFASELISRGYIYVNQRDEAFYAGLTDAGVDVGFNIDYALSSRKLTESQLTQMTDCQLEKETHAILVIQKSKKIEVVLGNGQRSTSEDYSVSSIDCVKAPGFLGHWRQLFNMGAN